MLFRTGLCRGFPDDLLGSASAEQKGQGQDGKERTTGNRLHVPDIGAKAEKPKRAEGAEWRE